MNHYELYLKFLQESNESEIEWGTLALTFSKLLTDIPPRARVTQAFNILGRFGHRTPGWKISHNSKYQKTLRRNGNGKSSSDFEGSDYS